MYNEVIELISEATAVNDYGDMVKTQTVKEVFAEIKSIGMSEFYQASAAGLSPEIKFVLPDYLDYSGEKIINYCPYNGSKEEYTVIRTYRNGVTMELTCKRGVDR